MVKNLKYYILYRCENSLFLVVPGFGAPVVVKVPPPLDCHRGTRTPVPETFK